MKNSALESHQQPVDLIDGDIEFDDVEFLENDTVEQSTLAQEEETHKESADSLGNIPAFPHAFWHPLRATAWVIRTIFGIATLIVLLAVVAAIPVVNFLALGYLLEVEGRVARAGKFRYAFPLLDLAPRIGVIVMGIWLWVIPIRLLSGAASDAHLIDPGAGADLTLHALTLIGAIGITLHLCLALARGGSMGCFFRPIKNLRWIIGQFRSQAYWETAEVNIREYIAGLRLRHHFSLGLRGFFAALLWLFIPTALLATANRTEGLPIFVTIIGGLCLVPVMCWLPFLHAHFAAENRFKAIFELRAIRERFRHAPLAWMLTVIVTYVLALPLYLLKVALPPSDAMWLVTIVFVVSIYPAKVLAGWAYHRASARDDRAWWGLRWLSRTVIVPLAGLYVFLVFFTQFIGAHGKGVLFEQHAFLLPVPF